MRLRGEKKDLPKLAPARGNQRTSSPTVESDDNTA